MRYIRFLKTPRIVHGKNSSSSQISCLITITSDLGDSFHPCHVTLSAELCLETTEDVILVKTVVWTPGMRSLPFSLPLASNSVQTTSPLRVRVGVLRRSSADNYSTLSEPYMRGVVSAWSAPLNPTKGVEQALKLVERRFSSSKRRKIRIWEETGESIARHLWDAGITLSCHLSELADTPRKDASLARALCASEEKARLQVIELGTGCGIVGITIAQAVENADVILTDLPEAEEIVQKNIDQAKLANQTTLRFQTLDWDDDLPKDLNNWSECRHCLEFDFIVAADCTYNPDSSPAFVQTISRLAQSSPNSVVAVAMKMRHSSEEVFFSLMADAGFTTTISIPFPLPGDEELGEETVYVHLYRYKDNNRSNGAIPNELCPSRKSIEDTSR